jgi:hypothetical protein
MLRFSARAPTSSGCRPQRRPEKSACCFQPNVPIDRPDPATYSQRRVLASGGSPSWDSPDILTNSWSPWRLLPESRVTVRNLSLTATAANVQVGLSFSPFGIGLPVAALGAQSVTLAPSANVELLFPLTQALLAGDQLVSVFVDVVLSTDKDFGNNHGEQAIIGGLTSEVGRVIEFVVPVRNPAAYSQAMSFVTYANSLGFTVGPTSYAFAPLQQILVHGRIIVPSTLHASSGFIEEEATMAAFGPGGALIGGATYVVHIND